MKQQKLSSLVQGRVLNFFDYLWIRNKGTDPQCLLEDMPYCMQSEVSLATTENLIKQVHYTIWVCINHSYLVLLTRVTTTTHSMLCDLADNVIMHAGTTVCLCEWCISEAPHSEDSPLNVPTRRIYSSQGRCWTGNVFPLSWKSECTDLQACIAKYDIVYCIPSCRLRCWMKTQT